MYYLTPLFEQDNCWSIGIANEHDLAFQLDLYDRSRDELLRKANAILETLNKLK